MTEWTWIQIPLNVSDVRLTLQYLFNHCSLAASDQDESSRSERTGFKSLDIPRTPCPTNELSTISQRLLSGKRLAGPDDDTTDPSAIRLLQGHKTEV
jgi:hypothetical protein